MIRTFTKMQALGNDFVFFDATKHSIPLTSSKVKRLCNRRLGIGADQLIVFTRSKKADFRMTIYNADGSEAGMCGNGLRCLAYLVRLKKLAAKPEISVETSGGVHTARYISRKKIAVDMGAPILKGKEIPVTLSGRVINRPVRIDGKEHRITCVSFGNPHCVIFVDDVDTFPVGKMGPILETHSFFPKRTNVEFVQQVDKKRCKVRVWERGVGETPACGSGACASVVAGALNRYLDWKVSVELPGGTLLVHWNLEDDHVYMTGEAEMVFDGSVEL